MEVRDHLKTYNWLGVAASLLSHLVSSWRSIDFHWAPSSFLMSHREAISHQHGKQGMSQHTVGASWNQGFSGLKGTLKIMSLQWTSVTLTHSFSSKTSQKGSLYICCLHLPTSHVFFKPIQPMFRPPITEIALVEDSDLISLNSVVTSLFTCSSATRKHSAQWSPLSSLKYSFFLACVKPQPPNSSHFTSLSC